MSSNGAQRIIRLLAERGVDLVAGMPGGAVLPLYEALDGSRIRHVLVRHEQAAGFIAQGIARIRGRAGVCFVTSGPGVTNVLTALADARLDSVPLVCIAGQVPTHLIGTDAFQEVDATRMAGPVTKARYFVDSAARIPAILAEAFDTAEHGRPGPVLIDIPKNVQCERMETAPPPRDAARSPDPGAAPPAAAHAAAPAAAAAIAAALAAAASTAGASTAPASTTAPSAAARSQDYDRAAALIAASERPLLYLGGGVILARAQRLALELAEQAGIPAVTSLMGLGILPHGHALSLGMLGMHGARYTNLAVEAADLLIAIGARFDDRATGDPRTFASGARVIHIDIDPRELGKLRAPDLAIQDDAAAALRELLQRVDLLTPRRARRHTGSHDGHHDGHHGGRHTCRRAWHAHLQHLKSAHPLARPRCETLCSPYGIMAALGERLPTDAIVTTDVGQHQMWAAQALPLQPSHRWLTSGGLGTMGFGLPAAIGAALASEDAKVVCITGDGSLLMNVQELATLAELDLDVKVIALDNAALGLVRQQQELFHGGRYVGSRFRRGSDLTAIARAFGVRATDLGVAPDPRRALDAAMAARGPALIRVPIDETEHVLPLVPPGAANTQPLDHPRSVWLGDVESNHDYRSQSPVSYL